MKKNLEFFILLAILIGVIIVSTVATNAAAIVQWLRAIANVLILVAVTVGIYAMWRDERKKTPVGRLFFNVLLAVGFEALALLSFTISASIIGSPPFWVWSIPNFVIAVYVLRLVVYLTGLTDN